MLSLSKSRLDRPYRIFELCVNEIEGFKYFFSQWTLAMWSKHISPSVIHLSNHSLAICWCCIWVSLLRNSLMLPINLISCKMFVQLFVFQPFVALSQLCWDLLSSKWYIFSVQTFSMVSCVPIWIKYGLVRFANHCSLFLFTVYTVCQLGLYVGGHGFARNRAEESPCVGKRWRSYVSCMLG